MRVRIAGGEVLRLDAGVKPFVQLATATTADGTVMSLHTRAPHFFLRVNGEALMATNAPVSEEALAELACEGLLEKAGARVLIGGLGLGFSLREVLRLVGAGAEVVVAELVPEVVEWNRSFMADVNGGLLNDPRVKVAVGDVWAAITNAKPGSFDAILLDVDNGPSAVVQNANNRLYDDRGLRKIWNVLKPGGRLTIWSADDGEKSFVRRFRRAGFAVEVVAAKAMTRSKRCAHTIFVGKKSAG